MQKAIFTFLIVFSGLNLLAQFEDLDFGTDSTLDVVSWNIEHFPKNGQTTVDYVVEIIEALDADVVAIQEMTSLGAFQILVDALDGWEGHFASNPYAALTILYRTEVVHDPQFAVIYDDYDREFPRAPLLIEMVYEGETYIVVNNHLKCCGDQYLDMDDDWDEEKRRFDACNLLDEYIEANYPDEKVIVLGDLNDVLTDSPSNNVFQMFIDDPDSYNFVDMEIAEGSSSDWSYPSWPSHIDHIMITNELFSDFENEGSSIETIKVDEYFNSFWDYDENVSDHRPVGLKIKTSNTTGLDEDIVSTPSLLIYPNPVKNTANIVFDVVPANGEIVLLNMTRQTVLTLPLSTGRTSVALNMENLPPGIYVALLQQGSKTIAWQKIVRL